MPANQPGWNNTLQHVWLQGSPAWQSWSAALLCCLSYGWWQHSHRVLRAGRAAALQGERTR